MMLEEHQLYQTNKKKRERSGQARRRGLSVKSETTSVLFFSCFSSSLAQGEQSDQQKLGESKLGARARGNAAAPVDTNMGVSLSK